MAAKENTYEGMIKMKKVLTLLLSLALVLSLAACAGDGSGSAPPTPNVGGTGSAPSDSTNDDPSDGSNDDPNKGIDPGAPVLPAPGDGESDDVDGDTPPSGGTEQTPPMINVPGGGNQEAVPVTDAGDLKDKLSAICEGSITNPNFTDTLRSSAEFSNYFGGKVSYEEGMRVAVNHLEMNPPAHIVLLIEPLEGVDAGEYAKTLEENADPRWAICDAAETVKVSVNDGLVLVVMSSAEITETVTSAFEAQ